MAEEKLIVGTPLIVVEESENKKYSAFFEDEGETGYFYAVDLARSSDKIVDALHIYNVANVVDRDKPSKVRIAWSQDGMKCALLINDYPHAAFDFSVKRGYCRTNFPNFPREYGDWDRSDHSWCDDSVSWL